MKKFIIITSVLMMTMVQANAQKEFRLAKTSGRLVLKNISNLTVEGYDGKEIIFSLTNPEQKNNLFEKGESGTEDPRAKGLSALNNNGFDNTGLGLSVLEKEKESVVTSVSNQSGKIKIKLPNTVALSIQNAGWPITITDSNSILLNNIKNEMDISLQYENCKLTNVTGPLSIKTLSGNVEIVLNNEFKSPVSIYTVRGFIDMTVQENSKADVEMRTMRGTIYADKNLKLKSIPIKYSKSNFAEIRGDSVTIDGVKRAITIYGTGSKDSDSLASQLTQRVYTSMSLSYSGSGAFNGTLNGGGGKIVLQSTSGNIYLRE